MLKCDPPELSSPGSASRADPARDQRIVDDLDTLPRTQTNGLSHGRSRPWRAGTDALARQSHPPRSRQPLAPRGRRRARCRRGAGHPRQPRGRHGPGGARRPRRSVPRGRGPSAAPALHRHAPPGPLPPRPCARMPQPDAGPATHEYRSTATPRERHLRRRPALVRPAVVALSLFPATAHPLRPHGLPSGSLANPAQAHPPARHVADAPPRRGARRRRVDPPRAARLACVWPARR